MNTREAELRRMESKTAQARLKSVLEQEFHYAPKIAEAIVEEAQDCLYGPQVGLQPGQMRVILSRRGARAGQGLAEIAKVEVIWTVDAGAEDREVERAHGAQELRRVRIQRLLDEALEQGGVASQEDLAQVLHSSVRTIKRDFAALYKQGTWLPSRGMVQGIGRGQTHKGEIIHRWLSGETYDQLESRTHHHPKSIERYVRAFVQVVRLLEQGFCGEEIARLLQIGLPLVEQYQGIYASHEEPVYRQRLNEQLQRFQHLAEGQKGAK